MHIPITRLDPDAVLPGQGRVAELVAGLAPVDRSGVRRTDLELR